jgi:signal peptidase II
MSPKLRSFLTALALVLPLDQLTKQWAVQRFAYGEVQPVIPGWLDWTHVRNPGGAFSFFADGDPSVRSAFFVGASLVAIAMLLLFFIKLPRESRLTATALGVVLGGAVGNLIDRLIHGEVIDWIDVHLTATYTWPTFNVADSCIVVGVIVLLIETFFESTASDSSEDAAPARPSH